MRGAQVSRVFTETLGTLKMHFVPAHQGYQEYLGRMVSVGFQIFPFVIINVKIRINHTSSQCIATLMTVYMRQK